MAIKKNDKPVVVVIPVYKELPNHYEQLSLLQCLKVLKDYPLIFIAPEKLNTSFYEQLSSNHEAFVGIKRFDDYYFSGINGYNKLMLSADFYKVFLAYKFILIHQLDAYVFSDELSYWCNQNFDFIGAPHAPHENRPGEIAFLQGFSKIIATVNRIFGTALKISNVGNGGLSLRKTAACYNLLRLLKSKVEQWGTNNEDGFFKYWGNLLRPWFKLPSDEIALHFSIEQRPGDALKKLGNQLPFGCHAFEKYEPETWVKLIPGLEYAINRQKLED